eukprot:2677293-Rhodomonas_salina.1
MAGRERSWAGTLPASKMWRQWDNLNCKCKDEDMCWATNNNALGAGGLTEKCQKPAQKEPF